MYVIATAGHVDHGKSSLVSALTGMDPDRLAAERERGLSIELGYCSTTLEPIGDVAFIDVPGHERFISTMLSGIGPVPAVLFVVAADDRWMPQAAEHLTALDALGVTHGVLAVTRCDLTDPQSARMQAQAAFRGTTLQGLPSVSVSTRTGQGLDELRSQLASMLMAIRTPDSNSDVRLWVDRSFNIHGSGKIVTGTLSAGQIGVGDALESGAGTVRVRGMQALGQQIQLIQGPARVALNLSGEGLADIDSGSVLVSPQAWHFTQTLDVRVQKVDESSATDTPRRIPRRPMLHIGAAALPTNYRALSTNLGRISIPRSIPLRIGDRALLRDPGSRQVWGITVLDPAPPVLNQRGSSARRAEALSSADGKPHFRAEVARRGIVSTSLLRKIGVHPQLLDDDTISTGDWIVDAERAQDASKRAEDLVRQHDRKFPLDRGVPIKVVAETLGFPSVALVKLVVRDPLQVHQGKLIIGQPGGLPAQLTAKLAELERDFDQGPFAAPTADRLRELHLDIRSLAAAERAHLLIRLATNVVLLPGADLVALNLLRDLPQPFTTSEARTKLGTSRRVALPLLEYLDKQGHTSRLPDDRRTLP